MKTSAKILAVSALVVVTLCGARGIAAADETVSASPAVADNAKLSQPARDIVKMTVSGVPEDVIRSYINNSPSVFNLSADNIINLQGVGVTAGVTASMLNHDKSIRDNAPVFQQPVPGQPPAPQPNAPYPPASDQAAVYPPAETQVVYNYSDLSPYGSWNYLADYGWSWQPFGWLGYNYYPWGLLRFGNWWNCPGRGWCWFPGSHFRAGVGFRGGEHGFFGGTAGFGHGGTGFNHGVGGFGHVGGRPTPVARSGSISHVFHGGVSSFHATGFSGGGGHFGGSHASGGGGGHFSGGGHSGGGHR
jgi:hypothetical protein